MLSSETTRLTPVLNRLSTLTMNIGEKTGIVNHFEARSSVPRMMDGVYSFKRQWEEEPARREELTQSVTQASEVYTKIEKRHTHIQQVWNNRRTDAEMKRLEAEIKAKQAILDKGALGMADSDRVRFELSQLESEQAMARESRVQIAILAAEQQNSQSERPATTESASLNNAIKRAQNEEIVRVMAAETQKAYLEAQEAYKTQLTGYLFVRNKEEFVKTKSADAFDEAKERRQVEGVIRSQFGEHLHMGTGEGKSTVVLPISALVEAATNKKRTVVVASANGLLVEELKENTVRISHLFDELHIGGETTHVQAHDVESQEDKVTSTSNAQFIELKNKSFIRDGEIDERTTSEEKKRYWEGVVRGINGTAEEKHPYLKEQQDKSIHLYFSDEKELVWQWMENKKAFEANCPPIFMDEAHVAFDKHGTYSKTSPSEALAPVDVQTGTAEWLTHYMVGGMIERMKKSKALFAEEGGYELTEQAKERVRAIRIEDIEQDLEQRIKHGRKHKTTIGYANAFYEGVDVIAKYVGVKDDGQRAFTRRMLAEMKHYISNPDPTDLPIDVDPVSHNRASYLEKIGNQVAKFINLRDKIFTQRGDRMVIRDAYTDELLEGHKYEPEAQVAIMAISKKFDPIKREVAHSTSTYTSFIHAVQNKFVAFSGTLMYPDARKGTMKKGSFARFLESTTRKQVHMIESTEIKPFPRPQIDETRNEMYGRMEWSLEQEFTYDMTNHAARRPTLMVDFNGLESAVETYDRMRAKFGDSKVRLLLSRPTGGDKAGAIEYKRQLDKYRRQLAEGEIDMLISSGSAALGVNFEKSTGEFPNLRTVMVGLPDSEQRVTQTIGRRRMREHGTTNHLWFTAMDDIELQLSHLEKSTRKIFVGLHEQSRQQVVKTLRESTDNPEKMLDATLTIMEKVSAGRASDTDYQQMYDEFLDREVVSYASAYMKRRIAREMLHYDEKTIEEIIKYDKLIKQGVVPQIANPKLRIQARVLDNYFSTLGLPSTIYNDVIAADWIAQIEGKGMFDTHFAHEELAIRLNRLKQYVLLNPKEGFEIDGYLDNWYEQGVEATRTFTQIVNLEKTVNEIAEPTNGKRLFATMQPCDIPAFDTVKFPDKVLTTISDPQKGSQTLVSRYMRWQVGEHEYRNITALIWKFRPNGAKVDTEYTYFEPVGFDIVDATGVKARQLDIRETSLTYTVDTPNEEPGQTNQIDLPLIMLTLS